MMDYDGFSWGLFILAGLVPGSIGAGLSATVAWRRGAAPVRVALMAVLGFAAALGFALVLVLLFLRY